MRHNLIPFGGMPAFGKAKSALVFNHIHKCAGTTFAGILKDYFGEAYYDATYLEAWKALPERLCRESRSAIAIGGHTAAGMHEFLPPDYRIYYVTLLRHPLERFFSAYRFGRSRYAWWQSPDDFLRGYPHNFLVHWLGEGDLEQARQRLRDCYLFGLVEHFQDFLSSFSRLTGITVRTLNIQNATRERTHRNPELIEQFNRSNADDLALYEWARQWLTKHDLLGEKPVPQTAPTSTGDVGLAPTQDAIRVLIDNGQWQQAAERIAQLSDLTSSHYVHLGNLYKQMGRPDLATPWYEKSCAIDRDAARWLAPHYRQTDPQKANELLQTTLAYFADVPSTLEQSYLNRFRAALRQQLD